LALLAAAEPRFFVQRGFGLRHKVQRLGFLRFRESRHDRVLLKLETG